MGLFKSSSESSRRNQARLQNYATAPHRRCAHIWKDVSNPSFIGIFLFLQQRGIQLRKFDP